MKLIILFLAIFSVSTSLNAKGIDGNFKVATKTYADGILFEADNRDINLQLTVAGPDNARYTQRYSSADPAFLNISNTNGQPLADGFYKYEVWPIPAVTYSREESSSMPDRNSLKNTTGPKVSAVSGSFRIVNGVIDDPELIEFDAGVSEGTVK